MLARILAGAAAGERHIVHERGLQGWLEVARRDRESPRSGRGPWSMATGHKRGALLSSQIVLEPRWIHRGKLGEADGLWSMQRFGKDLLTDLERYFRPCHSQRPNGSNVRVDEVSLS